MNKVLIQYETLKRYCEVSINGERVSEYSDIAGCETKDLHICGSRLLSLLDSEIGDDYELTMYADPFLVSMMGGLADNSEWCKGVKGDSIKRVFAFEEMLSFMTNFVERYHLDVANDLNVYAFGDAVNLADSDVIVANEAQSNLMITADKTADMPRGTILLLGNHYEIHNEQGRNIVIIPSEQVHDFCRYYKLYTKQIPFIEAVIAQSRYLTMSALDAIYIQAYSLQMPKYLFELNATQMDVGTSIPFTFSVIPPSSLNAYSLKESVQGLVQINGATIEALKEGNVTLSVIDKAGKVHEEKSLRLIKHSYVTSIRLMANSTSIEVGKKGHIDAYLNPEDAEDAKELKWNSSDTDVIHITSDGDIIALKPGNAVITASCSKCAERIQIQVLPALEHISISPTEIRLEINKTATVQCSLYPSNAAHGQIIWKLSNDGMGSLKVSKDGLTCQYTPVTSTLTKGALSCKIKGTEQSASCAIETVPEDKPVGLMTCAIIFTILGCIFSFAIPLAWLGGAGIAGYFLDIFLPVSLVLCLVGKSKTNNEEKTFSTCLNLNLIFTGIMFLLSITACNPR